MSDAGHGSSHPLPLFDAVEHQLHSSHEGGFHTAGKPLIIAFIVGTLVFLILSPAQSLANFSFAIFSAPLWLTPILVRFGVLRFILMRQAEFIGRQEHVLLELRLPRDTMKTPVAMESVLSAMSLGPGETNWYKKYVGGGARPWYSLELVSLGGRVHFYVWTRTIMRRAIESAFYAQYPDMEIVEAVDYSRVVDPSHAPYEATGFEYALKSDPLPLKSYIDYGLDKVAKPEEQTDPLSQIIELLGSLGPNEQMWIQFVIRTNKHEKYRGQKKPDGTKYEFKDAAAEELEKIRAATVRKTTRVDPVTGATSEVESFPNPSKGQQESMWGIERKLNKITFDTGVRVMYLAPKKDFQGIVGAYMVGLFKPFSHEGKGNALGVIDAFSARYGNYPWDDPTGHHGEHAVHEITEFYRRRAFFYDPYRGNWSIMSTEELATLFHIPSSSTATPGLPRIGSATGGTPVNLPT